MKNKRKFVVPASAGGFRTKLILIAALALSLLAAGSLSVPGRSTLGRILALARPASRPEIAGGRGASPGPSPSPQDPDIEQKARVAHGWHSSIEDSVITGSVNFFDRNGFISRQASIKILRKYPEFVRIELTAAGTGSGSDRLTVMGFDGIAAWKQGLATLTNAEARDIRAWVRASPERLFVSRDNGHTYGESPSIYEDHRPAAPERGPVDLATPIVFNQARVIDTLGPPVGGGKAGDRRVIKYYVNAADSIINAALWAEPDDPNMDPADRNTDTLAVRVDYSAWQELDGVIWPFEITHWLGGKVDFRVTVSQVQTNQHLPGSLFQNHNQR
jgi:hypothetical protein